jgi:hypothetical protein
MSTPTSWVTEIINNDYPRAFKNLFNIHFFILNDGNNGSIQLNTRFTHIPYTAERITFGDDLSLETNYNEAVKNFFVTKANKIKTATIVFRETYDYKTYWVLSDWYGNIYNSEKNYYKKYDPRATITIMLDSMKFQNGNSNKYTFTIHDAYPTSITPPEYTWDSSDPQTITAIFSFRYVEFGQWGL